MTHIIRWQDVLDILIVAFIIYRLLLLIKGTGALQLVIGLTVVFFAFYVARRLDLFTLGWILNNFVAFAGIIIVVIFQNEIRRVLFALGRSPFFRKITYVDETLFYEEVANACVVMSKRRTGALIVIEQEMGLSEFMEVGVKVDAGVNTELDSEHISADRAPPRWGASHWGRTDKGGELCPASVDEGRHRQGLRDKASRCPGHYRSDRCDLRDRIGGIRPHLLCPWGHHHKERGRRNPEEGAAGSAQGRR